MIFLVYQYYRSTLNGARLQVYDSMYAGFKSVLRSFKTERLSEKEMADIFTMVKLDNPLLFYVTTFRMRWAKESSRIEIVPEYMFEKSKIASHIQAVNARLSRVAQGAKTMTEQEKELYIHDFICSNVKYDKLKKPYSHEIVGPLTHGIGVCDGIAKTVKALCDELDIKCIIPLSESDPENGLKYRHAWNVINISGKWYQLDVTYDNSLARYGVSRYDYYNLDDKHMYRDHRSPIFPVPECADGGAFYYKTNKMSFTKLEDVKNRTEQAIRKKRPNLLFHWRGSYLTRDMFREIIAAAAEAAAAKEKHIRVSVNFAQSVILLSFMDSIPAETETEEIPDEA